MYVCLCRGLTEGDVRRAARAGNTSGPALIATLGLDDPCCCGRCAQEVDRYIQMARDEVGRQVAEPAA